MLRLRSAADPAVSGGSPGLQPVPTEAKLLSDLPRPAHPEHPEPGHGEGGLHSALPLQGKSLTCYLLTSEPREHKLTAHVCTLLKKTLNSLALTGVCVRPVTSQGGQTNRECPHSGWPCLGRLFKRLDLVCDTQANRASCNVAHSVGVVLNPVL